MRRRRKPLEVSTFPFLAVLLCTMGSLILVLLVMDRKAKMAAREKAQATVARAADDAEQAAAARRAELERHMQDRRAEWEKKRDQLHTKLLTEQQALQLEMQELRDKITLAAARLRLEQEKSGELKKEVQASRGQVANETTALAATKRALADSETHTEQEKVALARMTNDLVVLERALKDLKEARERERQTYSVIPYNGKRGESRRPLYIECAGDTVIFHPDKKAVPVRDGAEIRAEVARRIGRQREQLTAAKMPADQMPYLMLLVRPDGIATYYRFEAALLGLVVQFGYELIDADWLLDFPDEDQPGTQSWQALAKQPEAVPANPNAPDQPSVRGVQFHKGALMQPVGSAPNGGPAAGTGSPGTLSATPGGQVALSDNAASPNGPVRGRPPGMGDGTSNRAGPPDGLKNRPTGQSAQTAPGQPLTTGSEPRMPGGAQGGNEGNLQPTPPPGYRAGNSDLLPPLTPQRGAAQPEVGPGRSPVGNRGSGEGRPLLPPLPGTGSTGNPGAPGMGPNAGGTSQGSGSPAGGGPGEGEGGGQGGASSILPPLPPAPRDAKRPPPMRSARLSGDRDYVIFIECRENCVVLYPSLREFGLSSLTGGANNPLVQAVQQMVERKQSAVRPGEIPYRPQVRFLVRPETLRAYHAVYPLFGGLPLAKTRQNLVPEDDVRSIVTGN